MKSKLAILFVIVSVCGFVSGALGAEAKKRYEAREIQGGYVLFNLDTEEREFNYKTQKLILSYPNKRFVNGPHGLDPKMVINLVAKGGGTEISERTTGIIISSYGLTMERSKLITKAKLDGNTIKALEYNEPKQTLNYAFWTLLVIAWLTGLCLGSGDQFRFTEKYSMIMFFILIVVSSFAKMLEIFYNFDFGKISPLAAGPAYQLIGLLWLFMMFFVWSVFLRIFQKEHFNSLLWLQKRKSILPFFLMLVFYCILFQSRGIEDEILLEMIKLLPPQHLFFPILSVMLAGWSVASFIKWVIDKNKIPA